MKTQHDPEETFLKWKSWLETILEEVQELLIRKEIYQDLIEIINGNPNLHKPSAFWGWLTKVYTNDAAVGIRKQLDVDNRSVSLKRLLKEIVDQPELLSRSRFINKRSGLKFRRDIFESQFDSYSGTIQDHIDPSLVEEDVTLLEQKAEKAKKYVNKRIAHFDENEPVTPVSFEEISECLEVLEQLVKKYYSIFNAVDVEILPVWQYDWKQIFREVWIPQE